MKVSVIAVAAACLLSSWVAEGVAQLPSKPGDWPQWRGPNRDGISLDKGLLKEWPAEGPKVVWQVDDHTQFKTINQVQMLDVPGASGDGRLQAGRVIDQSALLGRADDQSGRAGGHRRRRRSPAIHGVAGRQLVEPLLVGPHAIARIRGHLAARSQQVGLERSGAARTVRERAPVDTMGAGAMRESTAMSRTCAHRCV